MRSALLRALRIVARADSDPGRQALFERVRARSRAIRAATAAHAALRAGPGGAALLLAYGAAEYLAAVEPPPRPVLSLGIYATDLPALEHVERCVGREHVARLTRGPRRDARTAARALGALLRGRRRRRLLRLAARFDRAHGFLVACRLVATVAWHLRGRALLARGAVRAVLVTSDYHPESTGLCSAAREAGVPTVFVSHAHPHRLCPPLAFDLSILDGPAALAAYETKGPTRGAVLFRGVEGEAAPLDLARLARPSPVVGLFLPKEVRWEALAALIREARARFAPARFLVRWHPNMLEPSRLAEHLDDLRDVEVTPGELPLTEVARRCDWVLAEESSNVHLGTLRAGTPSMPVAGLAVQAAAADYYGFIAAGVLPPACASPRDLSLEACARFFADGWAERFRRYDAAYLLPRAPLEAEVGRRVRALAGLVTRPAAAPPGTAGR